MLQTVTEDLSTLPFVFSSDKAGNQPPSSEKITPPTKPETDAPATDGAIDPPGNTSPIDPPGNT